MQGHMEFLFSQAIKFKVVVELGVGQGNSTASFLAGVEQGGGHLWSVDQESVHEEWKDSPLWTFILGNDLEVESQLPNEIDLLLIDTSHTYDHTLKELEMYGGKSKMTLCHDCVTPEVSRALNTYCATHNLTWEFHPQSYGLGVIEDAGQE